MIKQFIICTIIGRFFNVYMYQLQIIMYTLLILFLLHKRFQNYIKIHFQMIKLNEIENIWLVKQFKKLV